MNYKTVNFSDISADPTLLFMKENAVLTAGSVENCNSMLIGWGSLGYIWGKPAATVYVRPQRYTMDFINESDTFSVAFYGEGNTKIAPFGSLSGRDCDKYALTGIKALDCGGTPFTDEAKLVLICRKLSVQDMEADIFFDKSLDSRCYADGDYHKSIIGEITCCLVPEG